MASCGSDPRNQFPGDTSICNLPQASEIVKSKASSEDAVRAEHAEAVAMTDYFEQQQALWEDLLVGAVRKQAEGTKSAASEGGVKAAEREDPYSYENLTSKDPMVVVKFDAQPLPMTKKEGKTRVNSAELSKTAIQSADVLSNPPAGDMRYVFIIDLGQNVKINREGIAHGVLGLITNSSTMRTAEVSFAIADILRNSVVINEMVPRADEDGITTYVLFGIALRSDGNAYLVRSTVNHFSDNRSILKSVEVFNALKGIKAKMIDAGDLRSHTEKTAASRSTPDASIKINIADMLEFVKEQYPEYLPDSVRDHFKIDWRKEEGLRYSERDTAPEDRELLLGLEQGGQYARELGEYQKKARSLEQLQRKLERQRVQLQEMEENGLPRAEGSHNDSEAEGETPIDPAGHFPQRGKQGARAELEEKIRKTEASIVRAEDALRKMEKTAAVKTLIDRARADWREDNPTLAAKELRQLRAANRSLEEQVNAVRSRRGWPGSGSALSLLPRCAGRQRSPPPR